MADLIAIADFQDKPDKPETALVEPVQTDATAPAGLTATAGHGTWEQGLEQDAHDLLAAGREDVWEVLSRRFESSVIQAALGATRGRRIEAAQKLGIGRNTITRKIQELGLE